MSVWIDGNRLVMPMWPHKKITQQFPTTVESVNEQYANFKANPQNDLHALSISLSTAQCAIDQTHGADAGVFHACHGI